LGGGSDLRKVSAYKAENTKKKTCRPIVHALRGFRTNHPVIPTRRYRLGLGLGNDYHYIKPSATRTAIATYNTPSLCFTPVFVRLCSVPCQSTLLNLRSHTFGLTPFRWLGSNMRTTVTPFLMANIIFDLRPLFQNATKE